MAINLGFAVVEIIGGMWSGSVAVLSNAIHDLSDAAAVGLAYLMERMAGRRSNTRFSYGYRRLSLLSALVTSAVLLSAAVVVVAQAIPRLQAPVAPRLEGMAVFGLLGIVVNGYAAWRLARGSTQNERIVSWHMVEDMLGWATVLIGAGVMAFTNLPIIDPILCLMSSALIIWGVLRNFQRTARLFLQATPEGVDLVLLRQAITKLNGVQSTHDVHLWSLDGQSHVLTMHVVVHEQVPWAATEELKRQIRQLVTTHGNIHLTVELEHAGDDCPAVHCVADEG